MALHSSFDDSTEAGCDRYSVVSEEERSCASAKKEGGAAATVTKAVECQTLKEAKQTDKQRPKETPPRMPKAKMKMFKKLFPSRRSSSFKDLSLKRVPTDETDETGAPPSPGSVTKSVEDSSDGKNSIPVTTDEAEPAAIENDDETQKENGVLTRVEVVDVSSTEKDNATADTKKSRKGHKSFRFLSPSRMSRSLRSKMSSEEKKESTPEITPSPAMATTGSFDEMMLLINDSTDDDSIDASSLASKYQIEVDTDRSVVSRIEKEEIIDRIRQATSRRSHNSSDEGSDDDGDASISDETYLEVERSLTRISTHASRLGVTERELLTILSKGTEDNEDDEGSYRSFDPSRTFDDESTIRTMETMETFEVNNTRKQSFAKEAAHGVVEMVESLFDRDLATIKEMIGELSESTDEGDEESLESTMEEEEVEEEKGDGSADIMDRYLGPGEIAEPYPTGMASM